MRTIFETELRKLFEDGEIICSPQFIGRTCMGTLGKDLRVRAEYVTTGVARHYDAVRLTVLNRIDGPVDTIILDLLDLWGKKPVPNNPNFRQGVAPHIWDDSGKCEWYAYRPNEEDYHILRQAAEGYLNTFRDRRKDGPKLVYICAPLRGDVEKNVEFARQKAREVFASGDVPVCPHLLFPPIADPDNPEQDQAAREMGLRLVESCQQVNVYGPEWTDGMWAEIHHAMKLGIPVMTDQKTIGRTPPRQRANTKERRMTR